MDNTTIMETVLLVFVILIALTALHASVVCP